MTLLVPELERLADKEAVSRAAADEFQRAADASRPDRCASERASQCRARITVVSLHRPPGYSLVGYGFTNRWNTCHERERAGRA